MAIRELLYSRLSTHGGVSGLVSTRIYPALLPQNPTYPAISYQRISNTPEISTAGNRETRYQINCWAGDYDGADNLAVQVKAALQDHSDTDQTPAILRGWVANEIDDYDEEASVYRVIVDVMLHTLGD